MSFTREQQISMIVIVNIGNVGVFVGYLTLTLLRLVAVSLSCNRCNVSKMLCVHQSLCSTVCLQEASFICVQSQIQAGYMAHLVNWLWKFFRIRL